MLTMASRFLTALQILCVVSTVRADLGAYIPLLAPYAAKTVSPTLISLSIEQDNWIEWAGTAAPNMFFYNALDNLRQLAGEGLWIRIGADSEDHTNYNPDIQYAEDIFPAYTNTTPYPEATNITVGCDYYKLIAHLPALTHVWWGVNLGQYNITAAYLESQALLAAFADPAVVAQGTTLEYIEIGNEADLYSNNGARNSSWNPIEYTREWIEFATNISDSFDLYSRTYPKLIGGAFANSAFGTSGFSPQAIIGAGILNSAPGSLIRTVSQHHYSGSFCQGSGGLLQNLMAKSTIRTNVSEFAPDIAVVRSYGLDYVFGETNSYACHGAPGVSNTAGAAIWTLDYSLYASQIGISRLFFHEGVGYKYNLIQPVALNRSIIDGSSLAAPIPPHVQPQYYSAIIAAEAIGSSGSAQVLELQFDDPWTSGYAFYEWGVLRRALIVNSQAYLSGTTAARNTTHVDINFIGHEFGAGPTSMQIKRLNISYADATSGLTWGGQTYETSDARVSGPLVMEAVPVSQGVDVQETEVVMLSFIV